MPVTSVVAQSSSTCCAICTRPALRGERLCAQCKTAVQRARQVPRLQPALLPRAGAGAVAEGPPRRREGQAIGTRRAGRTALPAVFGGWGIYATLVAFGAAVSITGYFAMDRRDDVSARERGLQAARTASVGGMRDDRAAPAQPPTASSAVEESASGEDPIAQIEWTPQQAPKARSRGAPTGRISSGDARRANNELPLRVETRRPDAPTQPPPLAAGEILDGPRTAPAPPTQAAPTTDRQQLMAAAVARCERENFLAGFVCKERAWLQFCDGQWGEVPQCPSRSTGRNAH